MLKRLHWTKFCIALVALLVAANVFYNTMVAGNLPEPSDMKAGLVVAVAVLVIGAFVRFAFKSTMAKEHASRHMVLVILWLLIMAAFAFVVYPQLNWGSIRGSFNALTIVVLWFGLALFAAWEFPDWLKNKYQASKAKKAESAERPAKPQKVKVPPAHTKPDDEEDRDGSVSVAIVADGDDEAP